MTKDEAMARIQKIKFFEGMDLDLRTWRQTPLTSEALFAAVLGAEDIVQDSITFFSQKKMCRPTEPAALAALVKEIEGRFNK